MSKQEKPTVFFGVLPKNNVILEALLESEKLLGSVTYVKQQGDTDKPLRLIRMAIIKVNAGK